MQRNPFRSLILTAICLLYAVGIIAQTPAPTIPDGLRARFFKAHSESSDAQLTVVNAQKNVEAKVQAERQVIAELQQTCGEKFVPNMNQTGDVVCVAKPEAPKAPEKKPEVKK